MKYRVWDKFTKQYLDNDTVFIDGDGNLFEYEKKHYEDRLYQSVETDSLVISKVDIDHYIIEQFTGLKDCKRTAEFPDGQPIYEGDILSWRVFKVYGSTEGIEKTGIVSFHSGIFNVGGYALHNFGFQQPCEIIGNIHDENL